jgi:hypothetical protein
MPHSGCTFYSARSGFLWLFIFIKWWSERWRKTIPFLYQSERARLSEKHHLPQFHKEDIYPFARSVTRGTVAIPGGIAARAQAFIPVGIEVSPRPVA